MSQSRNVDSICILVSVDVFVEVLLNHDVIEGVNSGTTGEYNSACGCKLSFYNSSVISVPMSLSYIDDSVDLLILYHGISVGIDRAVALPNSVGFLTTWLNKSIGANICLDNQIRPVSLLHSSQHMSRCGASVVH